LTGQPASIRLGLMIRGGFLSDAERQALTAMARDGLAEHRIARRANAIVLLDKGWSCARVAGALLLDDDTVRDWFQAYESGGLDALSRFGHEGSSCRLTLEQQAALQNWITVRLPRSTRTIGAWLEKNHGFNYSRPGLIALLHRLGFDYRKPHKMPRGLNDVRQQAFIASYEKLLNTMAADEAVVFVDAVHPTHQVRAAGCWAPKDTAIAVEQTTGRQNLNIHGAINLETGQTQMLEVTKVNAISLIALLKAIEAAHPAKKRIHVYLDNASYHHANIVRDWLKEQHRKSVLHFIPPYCPHLDPIRTMLGSHARTHDPQQGLQNVPAIQKSNSEIPETHNSQELEPPLRSNHRQLPRHPPRQISGCRLAAV
jgi:transposase